MLTICIADHSKNPISSNMSEMRITATKVKVAFQTIPVTSSTSEKLTTPVIIAITAPINAVIPISRPLGCHITKINVNIKIVIANIVIVNIHLSTVSHIHGTVLELNRVSRDVMSSNTS